MQDILLVNSRLVEGDITKHSLVQNELLVPQNYSNFFQPIQKILPSFEGDYVNYYYTKHSPAARKPPRNYFWFFFVDCGRTTNL